MIKQIYIQEDTSMVHIYDDEIKVTNKGELPKGMVELINHIGNRMKDDKIKLMFENGIKNTYQTTIEKQEDGTTFVITGDIPAMWLRDSVAQVRPLLILAEKDEEVANLIQGVIDVHKRQILLDPYANAFNKEANGEGHQNDFTDMKPEVWERKYEIDSLCYPIQLAYLFWKATGKIEHFDEQFKEMIKTIMDVWKVEQHHEEKSPYSFRRLDDWLIFDEPERIKYETLPRDGKGYPVGYTGMTWSGFRPSDDACQLGYLVPSNMFAVVVLRYAKEIFETVYTDMALATECSQLAEIIDQGIKDFAIIDHPEFGQVFAYEVDGLGKYHFMDDANVPSLLSAPYLGYCEFDDEVYQNTRRLLLSKENPYYFKGKVAKGIGSPHTPKEYIWHIALAVQGLTSLDREEKIEILEYFKTTDAGTHLMHEGFDVNDPNNFTRPWFSWANSMFAEFILSLDNIYVKGSPLEQQKASIKSAL